MSQALICVRDHRVRVQGRCYSNKPLSKAEHSKSALEAKCGVLRTRERINIESISGHERLVNTLLLNIMGSGATPSPMSISRTSDSTSGKRAAPGHVTPESASPAKLFKVTPTLTSASDGHSPKVSSRSPLLSSPGLVALGLTNASPASRNLNAAFVSTCHNCGVDGNWARECPNVWAKMGARKTNPCSFCGLALTVNAPLSKIGRGPHTNKWGHEHCVLADLVAMGAITAADAERAGASAPFGLNAC